MESDITSCSSCGSALPAGVTLCDVCGHDGRDDRKRTPPTSSPVPAASPVSGTAPGSGSAPVSPQSASSPPRPQDGKRKQQPARKHVKDGATAAPLFNTMQWIAIVVAAFILGGVVGASFMPSGGNTAEESAEAGVQAPQQAQADLARLDETRTALEADPDNPDALLAYAHALHDSGMPDQAIVQYKRYLGFRPDDPDARVDLGICYFETKDHTTAIAEMERAVAGHPEHQLGHYNLGIVNLNAGNKEKAREWFEKARDINPSSPHGQNAIQLLKEQF